MIEEWINKWFYRVKTIIHWMIIFILFLLLIDSMIGFLWNWVPTLLHPYLIMSQIHAIITDMFSVLLMYELFVLSRIVSPQHLLDLVITIVAREAILNVEATLFFFDVVAFSVLLLIRLSWNRWGRAEAED